MTLANALDTAFCNAFPPATWRDVTVLLAVSGGPDSIAMLRAAAAARQPGPGKLAVIHFDHRWRAGSADDAQFVIDLCCRLEIPCMIGVGNPDKTDEAAARNARLEFFCEQARSQGARYVLTAHTASDQVETVLHRILRGTGLAGLTGIPRVRELVPGVALLRPLLDVSRQQTLEYLEQLGQPFRTDPTNANTDYTRNRLRSELLPLLRDDFNPQVDQAVLRLVELAEGAQEVVAAEAAEILDAARRATADNAISLDVQQLTTRSKFLACEALLLAWKRQRWPLQEMGYAEWERIVEIAVAGGRAQFPGNVDVSSDGKTVQLAKE
ncbi:MAG: tRNA lysidine(34) synthetase TilS [Pirellulaceae bacterium]|jgi:tRNA(Ile)-lysidine synthase|nr:tRNA lysidine(34) synthetase TilS [Pirellulaceae bacterium]MDP7019299.1 tRNA lysidine(34) synthetase TilS [Pirellulaceae bacterium]